MNLTIDLTGSVGEKYLYPANWYITPDPRFIQGMDDFAPPFTVRAQGSVLIGLYLQPKLFIPVLKSEILDTKGFDFQYSFDKLGYAHRGSPFWYYWCNTQYWSEPMSSENPCFLISCDFNPGLMPCSLHSPLILIRYISKSVPGSACHSLYSLTAFAFISNGYSEAVPLRDHIDIFSSLPGVG